MRNSDVIARSAKRDEAIPWEVRTVGANLPPDCLVAGRSARLLAMTPRLRRAYLRTRYSVQGHELRIGRRTPAIDALLSHYTRSEGVLVTAWNPRSRVMPRGWNERQQRRLLAQLRRHRALPAAGGLGRWHEDHVFVLAPLAVVRPLARLFRQHAVVVVRRGQRARLVFIA